MPEPILTTAALIAGAKTASDLLDSFSKVCKSVKSAAEAGQDLKDAGTLIGSIFTAEDRANELEHQAKSKGNLQEAMNLVAARGQIKQIKRTVRSTLAWECPTGMFQDWVAIEKLRGEFQEDLDNQLPTKEEKTANRKKIRHDEWIMSAVWAFIFILVIGGMCLALLKDKIKEWMTAA